MNLLEPNDHLVNDRQCKKNVCWRNDMLAILTLKPKLVHGILFTDTTVKVS